MNPPDVRTLVFDVFGTVVDWRSSVIAQGRALGADKALEVDWDAFVDDWKAAYRPGMDKVNSGEWPWMKVAQIYRRALDLLLEKYGVTGLSEAETSNFTDAWCRLDPWPDSVAGLTRLKRKYVLCTLSNGDFACLVGMAKHAGLPWDCVLTAENFRRYKPEAAVYQGAIDLLGGRPQDIMLVAAHNYDLAAAASYGMRTAFIPRPAEYGGGQTTDLGPEGDWDVVARDMEDLADRLGA